VEHGGARAASKSAAACTVADAVRLARNCAEAHCRRRRRAACRLFPAWSRKMAESAFAARVAAATGHEGPKRAAPTARRRHAEIEHRTQERFIARTRLLGGRALGVGVAAPDASRRRAGPQPIQRVSQPAVAPVPQACIQRVIVIGSGSTAKRYDKPTSKATLELVKDVRTATKNDLARGWAQWIKGLAQGPFERVFADRAAFLMKIEKKFEKPDSAKKRTRPGFPAYAYRLSKISYSLETGKDETGISLEDENLAMPHRFPYAAIQASVDAYLKGTETALDLERWSERIVVATEKTLKNNQPKLKAHKTLSQADKDFYVAKIAKQIKAIRDARNALIQQKGLASTLSLQSPAAQRFLSLINAAHGNISGLGRHVGTNVEVGARIHPHFVAGMATPGTKAALSQTPGRTRGVATTPNRTRVVTTDSRAIDPSTIATPDRYRLKSQTMSATTLTGKTLRK
jgi:hypothetical protein